MIRLVVVFLLVALLGLIVQSTIFHALSFSVIAPDFIVVLVVYLGLHYKSAFGVIAAFLLGLAADFASGQFIGPAAAGSIVAYNIASAVSQKVYAEHPIALVFLTFFCSLAKSFLFIGMLRFYTHVDVLDGHLSSLLLEALLSALIAPLVLRFLQWSTNETSSGSVQTSDSLRWSVRAR